jgi:hypothetical protein
MLIDHRTFTVRAGTLNAQLELYERHGWAAQKRHLGDPLAFLVTESGELNTYVVLWGFRNAADREGKRALLEADPDWQAFQHKSSAAGYVIKQESKLMRPAAFAPLEMVADLEAVAPAW